MKYMLFLLMSCCSFLFAATDTRQAEQTIKEFYVHIDALKKQGDWVSIVHLGQQALLSANEIKSATDEMFINEELSSIYIYQGNLESALSSAMTANTLAKSLSSHYDEIKSLYLLSAVYRTMGAKEQDSEKRKSNLIHARTYLKEAKEILSKKATQNVAGTIPSKEQQSLEAKVLFNEAAANMDDLENGNLDIAKSSIKQSLALYTALGEHVDAQRATLRLAKIYVMENKYTEAKELLTSFRPSTNEKRLGMHYDFILAQAEKGLDNKKTALQLAQKAQNLAQKLGAQEDVNRINVFIKTLN